MLSVITIVLPLCVSLWKTVIVLDYSFLKLHVLFLIAAWQRTIDNFNLVIHSNVCEYLWGCIL